MVNLEMSDAKHAEWILDQFLQQFFSPVLCGGFCLLRSESYM